MVNKFNCVWHVCGCSGLILHTTYSITYYNEHVTIVIVYIKDISKKNLQYYTQDKNYKWLYFVTQLSPLLKWLYTADLFNELCTHNQII